MKVSRAWKTDLDGEEIGFYSQGDHLQISLFVDDAERHEAFLSKEQAREVHEELGKWLAAKPEVTRS